jgi:DNA-binding NarL/FixJ family response regulator
MSPAQDSARPRPRLVIVDADHRVRASLAALISSDGRIDVVAVAGHAGSALESIAATSPDVVVVDPRLPDIDGGVALLDEIRRRRPDCRIVILSWSDRLEGVSLASDPDSFVAKSATPSDLIEAILAAAGRRPEPASTPTAQAARGRRTGPPERVR